MQIHQSPWVQYHTWADRNDSCSHNAVSELVAVGVPASVRAVPPAAGCLLPPELKATAEAATDVVASAQMARQRSSSTRAAISFL